MTGSNRAGRSLAERAARDGWSGGDFAYVYTDEPDASVLAAMPRSFTFRLFAALIVGLAVAVIVSPFAAAAVAEAGFRFPFPRVFDRVVMVSLGIVMLLGARSLRFVELLKEGFARPESNLGRAVRGFAVAVAAMAILIGAAIAIEGPGHPAHGIRMLPKYAMSAVTIAIIEEGFFRAFLFRGMEADFGRMGALLASSAVYAAAHLVRAPGRFYVSGVDLSAGLRTLALSFSQFQDPTSALTTLFGLFLLGILLAEACVLTGTVWYSAGLHAGFVIGAKLWPKMVAAHGTLPGWLGGWGHQPVISGAAAWVATLAVLVWLRPLTGVNRSSPA